MAGGGIKINNTKIIGGADGKTPVFKIENGKLYNSYRNGEQGTWYEIGQVQGEQGLQGETGPQGDTPYIGENGNWWIGTNDTGVKASGSNIDTELSSTSTNPVENRVIFAKFNELEEALYKPIDITSFVVSPSIAEKGSTVTSVTLSWKTNKTPTELTLDGATISNTLTSTTLTGLSLTAKKTYTLIATDEKSATDTAYAYINFYNGVYYGVATEPTSYDSSFIIGLTKSLQGSKAKTFTVTADANKYIYYCLPSSYITDNNPIVFNVGGFDGGFSKVATISFTNANNYTESYDIYRSDNANLGNTTVKVS